MTLCTTTVLAIGVVAAAGLSTATVALHFDLAVLPYVAIMAFIVASMTTGEERTAL